MPINPMKDLRPLRFNFVTHDEAIWQRIVYLKDVMANPDRYLDVPDKEVLLQELKELLALYITRIDEDLAT